MKTVNAKGLKEIRGYLSDLHKQENFTDAQVLQFATNIEDSLNDGGHPMFVIVAVDSKSGVEEICYIDDEGYDIEYVNPTFLGRNHHDTNDCERYACRICHSS
jgi:hypothetical protein